MQREIQLFRIVGTQAPNLVANLIELWGKQEFRRQVEELLRGRGPAGTPLTPDLTTALAELRTEHDRQFPQYATEPEAVTVPDTLAGNQHFAVINERFPRIGNRLARLWASTRFSAEVNDLLNDTRAGSRQGFPPEVAMALFSLIQDHDKAFPQFVFQSKDIWSDNQEG